MCTWIIFLWMQKAGAFAFKQLCFLFHRESGACCMRRAVPIEKTIFSAVLCGERDALFPICGSSRTLQSLMNGAVRRLKKGRAVRGADSIDRIGWMLRCFASDTACFNESRRESHGCRKHDDANLCLNGRSVLHSSVLFHCSVLFTFSGIRALDTPPGMVYI